ncbi:MAG: phosphate signaling complex protein PhoU [Oscillospiraceae bacterium]|nr:phosphate signaling complex protein PhoU [Oscillospiraceae bacterium]
MRIKFDEQLRQLNSEMVLMCNMIEKAIQEAIDALFTRNVEKARQIMKDDELVDQEQKKIENICFQLLVQQQPVARDLRTITAAMKMVTDMERIGDHAADISELTVMMADSPSIRKAERIRKMAAEAVIMLLQAVEAYVERDMKKARDVIAHDDIVDDLFVKVKADLIEIMQTDTAYAEYAADLLMVNKYLERIADHATNIAEWVIFSINGRLDDRVSSNES